MSDIYQPILLNSPTVEPLPESPKTFKEIAQDFLDEINHQLEEGNIDLGIKTSVEDIYEMLDSIVEFL